MAVPREDEQPPRVLAIGAAGVDMVGHVGGPLEPRTSNPARIRLACGGVARNVAENLARLGQPTALISAIGSDFFGQHLHQQLVDAGVDTSALLTLNDRPSGAYLAIVDSTGQLHLALDDMRALDAITPDVLQANAHLFAGAAMVFLDANLAPETIAAAVHLAQQAGVPISADPVSRTLARRLAPHLEDLFLITPNAGEAEVLLGHTLPSGDPAQSVMAARDLVHRGVDVALIALAEFGVAYATAADHGHLPALRTQILDPTGAGDALTAAVIFGLLNDIPIHEAVRVGISAASLTLRSSSTVAPDLSLEKLYDQLLI
ncbi:MAG: carbohydrate kinase family protein [Chloroflexi bacterium]|nr:carbohydrate kinase family protein [Chloroflexota bacterium]